jgi:Carboxypeptidase regulatory-like domain
MKNVLLLASLLLCDVTSASAATLAGTVRDSEGAVIAKAHIVIHWDSSGANYLKDNIGIKEDIIATTDSNGGFSVDLPAGFYDVFVSAISFSPHCDKIRLKGKEPKKYEVKLKVSPVTSMELD